MEWFFSSCFLATPNSYNLIYFPGSDIGLKKHLRASLPGFEFWLLSYYLSHLGQITSIIVSCNFDKFTLILIGFFELIP